MVEVLIGCTVIIQNLNDHSYSLAVGLPGAAANVPAHVRAGAGDGRAARVAQLAGLVQLPDGLQIHQPLLALVHAPPGRALPRQARGPAAQRGPPRGQELAAPGEGNIFKRQPTRRAGLRDVRAQRDQEGGAGQGQRQGHGGRRAHTVRAQLRLRRELQGYLSVHSVVAELCFDKVPEVGVMAVKVLAKLLEAVGGNIVQLGSESLKMITVCLFELMEGKRPDMKTCAHEIAMFVFSTLGADHFVQLLNYALSGEQVAAMMGAMNKKHTEMESKANSRLSKRSAELLRDKENYHTGVNRQTN